jgi:hypothetical protein
MSVVDDAAAKTRAAWQHAGGDLGGGRSAHDLDREALGAAPVGHELRKASPTGRRERENYHSDCRPGLRLDSFAAFGNHDQVSGHVRWRRKCGLMIGPHTGLAPPAAGYQERRGSAGRKTARSGSRQ